MNYLTCKEGWDGFRDKVHGGSVAFQVEGFLLENQEDLEITTLERSKVPFLTCQ